MKRSLWKNNFKEIIKTRRRFISILVMAFLGVGFFSGLVATGPDMQDSLDKYADNSNLFDIDIVSTLGLTEYEISAIKEVSGIENVYGEQSKDSIVKIEDKEGIAKIIEYNENSNTPVLIDGRLPNDSNECLLDYGYSITDNASEYIGKTIIIENEDFDNDDNPIFTKKELTVVGIAESPIYISSERGNTTLGSGSINFFVYVRDDVINLDYYTNIYAQVLGAKNEIANTDKYWELVNPAISNIENIKQSREEERYNQLINEATSKLDDAQKEFEKKKAEVEAELNDAENKINDAKKQISDSEPKLNEGEKELNTKEANSKIQFANAEKQIQSAENEIVSKKQEIEKGKSELETKRIEATNGLTQINNEINEANSKLELLQAQRNELLQNGLDTSYIDKLINEVNQGLQTLNIQKSQIEQGITTAENQILYAETEIANAEKQLQAQKNMLASNKKIAKQKILNGREEIRSGRVELEKAKQELVDKEAEFQEGKEEANTKLADAQKELDDAKAKINDIEKAKWYVRSRKDNNGCTNISDAIKTITNVAKLFPVVFYLIAILISLTSMTRMIEEERIEIGTLKALGYTDFQIITKYILYSFLACIIGGFLGMTVGFYLLPSIVWKIYSTIYTIPKFYTTYRIGIGLLGLIIAFICIGGATVLVAVKELKNMPAILMRPKPPKNGKKIFLERLPFFWEKLNFSKKITVRNIFRYKKRAIMTVVGIAGCTGLMLTGFGLKDSVMDIPESQFGKIFTYDASIMLSNTNTTTKLTEFMNSNESIESYSEIYATTGKLKGNNINYDTTIFVPTSNENFEKVCHLIEINTSKEITLSDNGIIISNKVADFLNVNAGDTVNLIDSNDIEHTFTIDAVVENYVSHYVYMSKTLYEQTCGKYETNMVLMKLHDMSEDEKNKLSEDILNIEGVASISMISDMITAIDDMLSSLNYVVIILIVASALLAFVVLYNLANINIGERQREIATLKVLGFYDKEVDNYINKENIVFTVFGIVLGLIFGYFLTNMIIASVEIDKLRFIRRVLPWSYIYSSIITVVFSLIVNYIIHFVLRKIDMIESLKSVE